jgi:hypothetical protein
LAREGSSRRSLATYTHPPAGYRLGLLDPEGEDVRFLVEIRRFSGIITARC